MSQNIPENLKYTAEHEWAAIDQGANVLTVGITDFAQQSLGEVVFLELPEVGTQLGKDEAFGVVESIKSVSDLYAPVSGEVIEINSELTKNPEKINNQPYDCWLIKLKMSNENELENLLTASQYQNICS